MANEHDSRLEDETIDEIVEFEESTPQEDNSKRGYEDYVAQQQKEEVVEETVEEEEVPDKYRNKSIQDIVAMHQNAEKLLGKQSSEVGELRKVVDDFIQTQTVAQQKQAPVQEEDFNELDFFENPAKAVNALLENHPSVKQSREMASRFAQQEAVSKLRSNHPDYTSIIGDQKFLDWVGASKIRTNLLRQADAYDFDSADELFSLWKDRQSLVNETVKTETQARKQSVKNGSTGNVRGSSEQPRRKVYRRADIVELMTKDPERYQSMASEIRQAYAENRVK